MRRVALVLTLLLGSCGDPPDCRSTGCPGDPEIGLAPGRCVAKGTLPRVYVCEYHEDDLPMGGANG